MFFPDEFKCEILLPDSVSGIVQSMFQLDMMSRKFSKRKHDITHLCIVLDVKNDSSLSNKQTENISSHGSPCRCNRSHKINVNKAGTVLRDTLQLYQKRHITLFKGPCSVGYT